MNDKQLLLLMQNRSCDTTSSSSPAAANMVEGSINGASPFTSTGSVHKNATFRNNSCSPTQRLAKGQGLIEVCVGAIFLVMIGLAILDLGTFVMGGDVCGSLAKQAARAAGNAGTPAEAQQAVQSVQGQFKPSNVYQNLSLTMTNFDNTTTGLATVVGQVTIVLPVSVPFLQIGPSYTIKTQATEPIVGIPPADQT
jgi:hypothetical protein